MTAPKPYELRRLAADPSCPQHARDALSAAADERRYRICVGEVGVDELEAGVPYRVVGGRLARADEEEL